MGDGDFCEPERIAERLEMLKTRDDSEAPEFAGWVNWPENTGQCYVYDRIKKEMFIATIEQSDGEDKVRVWRGGRYYTLVGHDHQFLFRNIEWPDRPE